MYFDAKLLNKSNILRFMVHFETHFSKISYFFNMTTLKLYVDLKIISFYKKAKNTSKQENFMHLCKDEL
jgi:hypothetical protein